MELKKRKFIKTKSLLATALLTTLGLSSPAIAKQGTEKAVQGNYTVVAGTVETFDITTNPTTLEQLGTFDTTLENADWDELTGQQKRGIKKKFHLKGTLKGTIDLSNLYTVGPVVSHVMTDSDRSTVIRSSNDVFFR